MNNSLKRSIEEAEEWLYKHGHYKDDDGFWRVGEKLEIMKSWIYNGELSIKLGTVGGNLNASSLSLISLKNFPSKIGGSLYLINNNLKNFKNSPIKVIQGIIQVNDNNLTSLEGLPSNVSAIYYHDNIKLKTLHGIPIYNISMYKPMNRGTKVSERENEWYINEYKGEKGTDYYMNLLKYIIKNNEEDINKTYWPEGFLSKSLINSTKGISKFNL